MKPSLFILLISLLFSQSLLSQSSGKRAEFIPNPGDVSSVDAIVLALYDVISGEAGLRDWDRFRYLCKPNAQFNALMPGRSGGEEYYTGSVDTYIEKSGPFFMKSGFYEVETGRQVSGYRNVVHVFSSFASRYEPAGKIVAQGVNSIQLVKDEGRWWVVNVLWNNCPEGEAMPKNLLKKPKQMRWEKM